MSRERRPLQAQAQLSGQRRDRSSAGPSAAMVVGIVVVAITLFGVGAVVILDALGSQRPGVGQAPDPAAQATPPRPTSQPAPVVVQRGGKTDPTQNSGTPTAAGSTGPSLLLPPSGSGGSSPIVNPVPPVVQAPDPGPAAGTEGSPSPGASTAPVDPSPEGAPSPASSGSPAAARSSQDRAVDEALAKLTTIEDRVGQLLLLAWIGTTAEEARPALGDLRAGGIVFVQNASTTAQATAINQSLKQISSEVGLLAPLIAIDHEGGSVQRIRDARNYGDNWDLGVNGATDAQACDRGRLHALLLRDLGFSMNLAPVLDVNNNPANPVIGRRSYSADPQVVARLGAAYIRGLQAGGVAAVGKHFPGHGNTSVDSHVGLPSLPQTVDDLDRIELVPFRRAIEADVAGIMSAHIVFPAVDPSGDPATLSGPVMRGLLRERLNFKGLAVSDDMGAMRAITDNYRPGIAAVMAINAGVDMLIMSAELPRQLQARDALVAAVRDGTISSGRLDEAVRNVLRVKVRFGLLGESAAQPGPGCS
jgi:beta-glucosidase-like glycosyl hydrolase